ncbi:MAG: polyprenyl synthetase family protein [Halioglobus sp.]
MHFDITKQIKVNQQRVNQKLKALANPTAVSGHNEAAISSLFDACLYVVNNGGKRIRPNLVYFAAAAVTNNASIDESLDYIACAVELLHTYSLVHDDLPAMDDDDMRRGQPSCHIKFGDATAILVGDALQARAFDLLTQAPGLSPEKQIAMVRSLASAAGSAGMVGGQHIDICATNTALTIEQLQAMHELKTGAIICAALTMGGIAGGATVSQLAALQHFGKHIGLAFQVVDDILDVTADSVTLGKTSGKDNDSNKPTYVSLLGLEGAKANAQALLQEGHKALEEFDDTADNLRSLATYIVERNH